MTQTRRGYRLATPGDGGGFVAGGDVWNVYLFGMSRVGRATYWHLSVVGHRGAHTLTIKATTGAWTLTPPEDLLAAIQEWLITGERDPYAFAELTCS